MPDQASPTSRPTGPVPAAPVRWLAPYASQWTEHGGRLHAEAEDATRSPYQRDRDRVIHSTAFRRLQYKTQVFVFHESDHFRTRLTHTLEVAQVARSIARMLALEEDLTETLALAHDLGHPPFGHAGERALNRMMAGFDGYDHNAQSLRVVMRLEKRYGAFDGLNLTRASLDGLAKHNGPLSAEKRAGSFYRGFAAHTGLDLASHASLEAQVAAISDDIAYNAHDVEDGLRSGLIGLEQLRQVPLAARVLESIEADFPELDARRTRYEITRRLITLFIHDVVAQTRRNLEAVRPASLVEVAGAGRQLVGFSSRLRDEERALKAFLFHELYRHEQVMGVMRRAESVTEALFRAHMQQPERLPAVWRDGLTSGDEAALARRVCDYVAGMTDRFALEKHREIFDHTPDLR